MRLLPGNPRPGSRHRQGDGSGEREVDRGNDAAIGATSTRVFYISNPLRGLAKGKVYLSDVIVALDPRAEWEQVYWEGWRQMRAFYWDSDMGVWTGRRSESVMRSCCRVSAVAPI